MPDGAIPALDALSGAVEAGVREVVRNLMADFELTLGLAGCASVSEISRESVTRTD